MTANDISGRVPRWLDQIVREKSCLIQSFLRTQPSKIDQFHICVSWWRPKVCILFFGLKPLLRFRLKMKLWYRYCMFILFNLNKCKVKYYSKSLKQLKVHLSRFKLLPQPRRLVTHFWTTTGPSQKVLRRLPLNDLKKIPWEFILLIVTV